MAGIDAAFLIRRATAELEMARKATDPQSALLHRQLAAAYQTKLETLNGGSGRERKNAA